MHISLSQSSPQQSNKRSVDWQELLHLIDKGATKIKSIYDDIDAIVALSRGGLIPGRLIAQRLEIPKVFSFGISLYNHNDKRESVPSIYQPLPQGFFASNILIVDDIIDSGASIRTVVNYITKGYFSDNPPLIYSVFFKPNEQKVVPNFYSELVLDKAWIIMPWEKFNVGETPKSI